MSGIKQLKKISEIILKDDESIVLQELCYYCRDGVLARRKLGVVILTDKRFIILKSAIPKVYFAITILPVIIIVGVLVDQLQINMNFQWKVLITIISGGIIGEIGSLISKHLIKNKLKANEKPSGEIIASFDYDDIASAEKENKGIRKMLVVKLKDDTMYRVSVKDKDKWRTELLRKMKLQ